MPFPEIESSQSSNNPHTLVSLLGLKNSLKFEGIDLGY
jgi:hypothetical protein